MTKTSLKKLTSIVLAAIMLVSVFAVSVSAADTAKSSTGGGPVVLDASGVDTGFVEWKAWTWTGSGEGHWVDAHGTSAADITFDEVEENIIFAYFQAGTGTPDAVWTGKIGQTGDMPVSGSTFTVTSVGDGAVNGTWSGGSNPDPDNPGVNPGAGNGSYTVVLDASGVDTGYVDWRAWTWADGADGYWVGAHGTSAADITYDNVEKNVIFAYFTAGSPVDAVWTGKIGQTADMTVDGSTFVVDSVGDGAVAGHWTGEVVNPPADSEDTPGPDISEASPSESEASSSEAAPTAPSVVEPASIPSPTDPAAADEDTSFYVSAKSNVNTAGSKVKVSGDSVKVSYTLTVPEKVDDGQVSISYDTSKLVLNPAYNTAETMFPVVKDAAYNLNAAPGFIAFNFSGTDGKYDFTKGGVIINLVFTKKSASTVGTATVYMNVSELASKAKTYVSEDKVASGAGITVAQAVESTTPEVPAETEAPTSATNNITVNAKSNLTSAAQVAQVTNSNVKVTFNLKASELIAYGDATVTFDNKKLALENIFNTKETMFSTLNSNVSYRLNVSDGVMKFNFTSVDGTTQKGTYDFTKDAPLITLVFTVRAGAEGSTDVILNMEQLGSIDTKYIENGAVVAEGAVVAIAAAGEDATKSSTAPTTVPIATGDVPADSSEAGSSNAQTSEGAATSEAGSSESAGTSEAGSSESAGTSEAGSSEAAPETDKTTIKLTASSTKIAVGATTTIKATIKNGSGETKFASSKKSIATVSQFGVVKGLKVGSVYISAKNNGATGKIKITVVKKANTMTVKAKTVKVKIKSKKKTVKKKTFKKAQAFTIKKAKGKLEFKRVKGNKKITIAKKTGKITVKKGLKKGTYKFKVKVKAKGTATYKGKAKTVTVKVKVTK